VAGNLKKGVQMKKILNRVVLVLKHLVAFAVDLLFPLLDLLEAVLLVLPIPQTKLIVVKLEAIELVLIEWVNVLKEVKQVVEKEKIK
jgi:hypothetical protein